MTFTARRRTTPRQSLIRRRRVVPVVVALIAVVLCGRLWGSASPSVSSRATSGSASHSSPAESDARLAGRPAVLGEADGALPDGASPFDSGLPGVGNLDSALLAALRRAATDAAVHGVGVVVVSGWRSPGYQQQLLREAVLRYGSQAAAARWVATPRTSAHVSGDAVDVGPSAATTWLSAHGAVYGLCPTYANEPWHYELRLGAVEDGCPGMYADPTHDPRMQP